MTDQRIAGIKRIAKKVENLGGLNSIQEWIDAAGAVLEMIAIGIPYCYIVGSDEWKTVIRVEVDNLFKDDIKCR